MSEMAQPLEHENLPVVLEDHAGLIPVTVARVAQIFGKAQSALILTDADMEAGADITRVARVAFTKLEEARRGMVDPLNDQVKEINTAFKTLTGPLKQAQEGLKVKMNAYQDEQRRLAREEQDRLRKIEEDRVAAQAAKLEEEAKAKAEEAAAAALEAERLVQAGEVDQAESALEQAESKAAEAESKAAEAEHVLEEGIDAPAPLVATKSTHRGAFGGVSHTRTTWKHRLADDPQAFDLVPREWLVLDDAKIRGAITRKENPIREIPGLVIYPKHDQINR